MSSLGTVDPQQLIQAASDVQRKVLEINARNVANSAMRGAMKVTQNVLPQGQLGITLGSETVVLNPDLSRNLAAANGDESYWTAVDSAYTTFLNQLGTKGSPNSLDKLCQDIGTAFQALASANSPDKVSALVASIQDTVSRFNTIQDAITKLRTDIDTQKHNLIHGDGGVNELIHTISALNHADRNPIEEMDLNRAFFDLSQLMSVTKEVGSGPESNFFTLKVGTYAANFQKLLEKSIVLPITYQATPTLTPGTTPNTLMVNGVNIEPELVTGNLAGLIRADRELQNIQAVLDNFASIMRSQMNAMHNLGTSMAPPSTLTGGIGLYGSEGTATAGTAVMSGSGTWRIALLDPTNQNRVVDYVDVALQANETVSAFMTRVNALPTVLASGNSITLSLTASGQFQVASSNPALGVSVGSAGAADAMMCSGAVYNASQATNVSHFFHLNDLFMVSSTHVPGTFGSFVLNPNIVGNPQRLSGCKLLSAAVLTAANYGVMQTPSSGNSTYKMIGDFFQTPISIPTAGVIPGRTTSLVSYLVAFESFYIDQKQSSENRVELAKTQLRTLQKQFQITSGIDANEARKDLLETSRYISLLTQTYALLAKLDEKVLNILTQ